MRIVIVGPGALGCLFATLLAPTLKRAEDDIRLLDHRPERAARLSSLGILREADGTVQRHPLAVGCEPAALGGVDVLLVTVKSHALPACLERCRPLITPRNLLVFLQNGIAHLDMEERMALPAAPAFAVSSEGATLIAPGHVRHAGRGITHMGFLRHADERQHRLLSELVEICRQSQIDASRCDDILTQLWGKLFVNAGINPLTALYQCTNGQLLTSCAARGRLKKIVREAEAVARASGITIRTDPVQSTLAVCKGTATNISSMLQDRRRRQQTEIDAINGALVRQGHRVGIPTPVNETVVRQIKEMERGYRGTETPEGEGRKDED